MSSKIVKPLLIVAAVAVNVIPGIGQAISATIGAALSASVITAVTTAGITAGLGMAASALGLGPKSPKISPASRDRLYASIDPSTPRKWVFGHTAMATDIRYQEWSGNDQEYLNQIVHVASHRINGIESIYFEDELAWTASGGAQGKYAGYLLIQPVTEGTPGNYVVIGNGSRWGANRRLTGLAYVYMRFKITGNSKKAESPFAQSIPSRLTIIGGGSPVYDPRFDSTRGGSGTMRADDQTTWAYNYGGIEIGRNPANQLLTYLLGWRIKNPVDNTWKLALGRGLPPARIDFAAFITAANACDESVTLVGGGVEPRYRADGIFTEADDPRSVIDTYEATMNAKLRDAGGRFALVVLHNDLGTPRFDFDDSDVLGDFRWTPTAEIGSTFNEVRGRFTNPSVQALYQLVDYPRIREVPQDGIERVHTLELPLVQSGGQAQRLAKQTLARSKYQGRFEAQLGYRGWAVQLGDVVTLTFSAMAWDRKVFRVVEHGMRFDGVCPIVLQEEHPDIYLWDRDERPVVQPVQLVRFDPAKSILLQMLVAGEIPYAGGQSIESLKPAEPGANVTENHTSNNTVNVGTRAAAIINQILTDVQQGVAALDSARVTMEANIDNLWNTVGRTTSQGLQSRIVNLESTTTTQYQTSAQRITALESTVNTPSTGVLARLGTIESTVASNNTAISQRTTALESEIQGARGGFGTLGAKIGNFAGTVADALAGKASATALTDLSAEITTARGGYGTLSARFGNLTTTVADALAGKATTQSVTDLTATVNTHTGQITTVQTVAADAQGKINASVTLLVNGGGAVAGYRIQSNNTSYSTFDVLADAFRYVASGSPVIPFAISASSVQLNVPLLSYSGGQLRVSIG